MREPLKRDSKGRLVKGTPPGPGRPKGKTIKERVREYLENHPNDMEAFVKHFVKENRQLAWQMLEGRPSQDVTSAGEKIQQIPIYAGLSKHDSNKEDILAEEED